MRLVVNSVLLDLRHANAAGWTVRHGVGVDKQAGIFSSQCGIARTMVAVPHSLDGTTSILETVVCRSVPFPILPIQSKLFRQGLDYKSMWEAQQGSKNWHHQIYSVVNKPLLRKHLHKA